MRCTRDCWKYLFSNKVVNRCNILDQQIVGATSLNAFENGLDNKKDQDGLLHGLFRKALGLSGWFVLLVRPYKASYKVSISTATRTELFITLTIRSSCSICSEHRPSKPFITCS